MSAVDARGEVAVVRQPVADARRGVVGYELLFGGHDGERLDPGRDAKATSALLIDAFGDIGLAELSGRHPAWVSIARDFLVEVGPPPFRPDTAVLQLAAYPARDDLLGALQGLSRSGYTLALNDFDGRGDVDPLLALCPLVKVDVRGRSAAQLAEIVAGPAAGGATLVATGVDDNESFDRCQELGFSLFQGGFFALPSLVKRGSVATGGGLSALRSLGEINRPDLSFEELEKLIATDVGLSIKLLRYVNSAFFSLPRDIGSVREALSLLGTRTVKRWATVMAMASSGDAPSALVTVALQRARMCEMLAEGAGQDREGMFTVGLFSVADALLGAPMEEVLESLPFSEEIRAALLRREGAKGALLSTVLAYERGEFPVAAGASYRQAVEWADETERVIA